MPVDSNKGVRVLTSPSLSLCSILRQGGVLHSPIEYKFLYRSIWPIDCTLTSITTGQCGPGSNDNEEVLYISQVARASQSDAV